MKLYVSHSLALPVNDAKTRFCKNILSATGVRGKIIIKVYGSSPEEADGFAHKIADAYNLVNQKEERNLSITAEEADFLSVILNKAAKENPSKHIRDAAADILIKLKELQNKP